MQWLQECFASSNPSVKHRKVVLAAIQNMRRKQTDVWPRPRNSANAETLLAYRKHRRDPKRIPKADALQCYIYESKRININCTTTLIIDNVNAHALPRNWCLRPLATALNLMNLIWHGNNTEFDRICCMLCDLSFAARTIPNLLPSFSCCITCAIRINTKTEKNSLSFLAACSCWGSSSRMRAMHISKMWTQRLLS